MEWGLVARVDVFSMILVEIFLEIFFEAIEIGVLFCLWELQLVKWLRWRSLVEFYWLARAEHLHLAISVLVVSSQVLICTRQPPSVAFIRIFVLIQVLQSLESLLGPPNFRFSHLIEFVSGYFIF